MNALKADLHTHSAEDPQDLVRYSATELIDMACALGYSVLAITNHNVVTFSAALREYARERGLVLIPGTEATIEGRHVLLYNLDLARVDRSRIAKLQEIKDRTNLIMAPHPYFPSLSALQGMLKRHRSVFDAVELCHFYSQRMDFNRRARRFAERHGLPLVGTSDAHQRSQFHTTYSLIESEPEPEAVIEAVKANRVRVVTHPLPASQLFKINLKMAWRNQIVRRFGR